MSYYRTTTVEYDFDETVERVTDDLKDEGFGVLCDIDVQAKFAEKLDAEFRRYRILGACNPSLAKEALDAEMGLGTLLPCNVVVYEDDSDVVVAAVDPEAMLSVVDNPALDGIVDDVAERFDRILAGL